MSQIVRLQVTRPHTQKSRLSDRMNAFAGVTPEAEGNGLVQVLRQIDETILPRALTVTADTGHSLRLLVSNRRLMRVETVGSNAVAADAPSDPDEAAAQFSEALSAVLSDAQSVRVSATRYSTDAIFWDVGCGAGRIAALLGLMLRPLAPARAPSDPEKLLALHARARAELSTSGQILSHTASPEAEPMLEALLTWVSNHNQTNATVSGRADDISCIPLDDALDAVIIHRADGQTLAITPSSARDTLLSAWHSARAAIDGAGKGGHRPLH
ncbi:MAG: hypothetical protein AB3N23_11695 [Paracoccaceae bacterium]